MLVQWANIYLSLVSRSIVTLVVGLVTNPLYLLEQLADLMPEAAVYFIELIIMKILLVLPFELSRIWPWFRIEVVARLFRDRLTELGSDRGRLRAARVWTASSTRQDHGRDLRSDLRGHLSPGLPLRSAAFFVVPTSCTRGNYSTSTCPSTRRAAPSSRRVYTVLGSNLAGCFTFFAYLLLKEQYWHAWAVLVPTVGALVGWIFVSASYLHMNMTASIEIAVSAGSARSPPAFDQHWFRQPALDPNPDRVAKVEEPDDIHAPRAAPRRWVLSRGFERGGSSGANWRGSRRDDTNNNTIALCRRRVFALTW